MCQIRIYRKNGTLTFEKEEEKALFSLTCLFAIEGMKKKALPILSTAWYNKKSAATFSDIIAYVRRSIWTENYFNDSASQGDYTIIERDQWETLLDQLSRSA